MLFIFAITTLVKIGILKYNENINFVAIIFAQHKCEQINLIPGMSHSVRLQSAILN